jgi:TolA-binding protein
MKRILLVTLFTLSCLISNGSRDLPAADNFYLLKKADEERALGNPATALSYYQDYIRTHPLTKDTGRSMRSSVQNRQFHLRNLLTAYNNLFDIMRKDNQLEELNIWLEKLAATYQPDTFRSKNRYTLAQVLYENNRPGQSIVLYEKIIDDHINDYWAGNNKVFLRAASKLFEIYTDKGNTAQLERLYQSLSQCPLTDFDAKDKRKLASLFLKNDATRTKGEAFLADLLTQTPDATSGKSAFLKASIQMMEVQHQKKDTRGLKNTIRKTKQLISKQTSPGALYQLAIAYFKIGEKREGGKILEEISTRHPDTIWARKALFLLGRKALSEENWDEAIHHYATYIERYPQQTFFCLKAYSNLLDAHWSRDGNLEKQQVEISRFADILNETSDYETQLNMARDLQHKGFDTLAEATFTMGYTYAQEEIIANSHSLQAMRIYWQLCKYAYEIGRIDTALENGESVIGLYSSLIEYLPDAKSKKRADHYLSRTYLWLAKIYAAEGKTNSAKDVLRNFVDEYPGDSDTDYAAFQLAKLYEDDLEIENAATQYKKVKKGQWREKAEKALLRMGAR